MKKSTKITILVGVILIVLISMIGVTFAFFSAGGTQETANTFYTDGCLNISLTNASTAINLTNAYPITDVEGLDGTSYDFTITNTCDTSANYSINLESLNEQTNSLGADYIKVALSSDTVDNVISILSSNTSVTPEVSGAYEAYNLYTGELGASETKTYHLKLWVDYDATVEEAANKVYESKINVIANPETIVADNLEATFELNDKTLTSNLTDSVTSATYCVSTDNICTPSTNASISNNNSYSVDLEANFPRKEVASPIGTLYVNTLSNSMVCTRLNGTSKIICSNPKEVGNDELVEDGNNNLRYIGESPNNYVYFNCDQYFYQTDSTCERWRIVGIFNEDTHGLSGEQLVKIVKYESIGNYPWDDTQLSDEEVAYGTGDWSTFSLQATLNTTYLNDGIKNDTTRNMIEEVTWKLGSVSGYSNLVMSQWYNYERTTTAISEIPTTWTGKIGLIYPSDYGYATGGGTIGRDACLTKNFYTWDGYDSCGYDNYFFNGNSKWTITTHAGVSAFYITGEGAIETFVSGLDYEVYPAAYLSTGVSIINGDGSKSNPYTLTLN